MTKGSQDPQAQAADNSHAPAESVDSQAIQPSMLSIPEDQMADLQEIETALQELSKLQLHILVRESGDLQRAISELKHNLEALLSGLQPHGRACESTGLQKTAAELLFILKGIGYSETQFAKYLKWITRAKL